MKLSRISLAPYRPRVERVRPINYSSSEISTSKESPTSLVGSTRPLRESFLHFKLHENHIKPRQDSLDSSYGNVTSPRRNVWMNELKQSKPERKRKRRDACAYKKTCFLLCSTIIGAYLLAVTLAIVLALKLPRTASTTVTTSTSTTSTTTTTTTSTTTTSTTTTSTTTTTTTTPECIATGPGTLLNDHSNVVPWTQIVRTFTANSTYSLLTFAQAGGGSDYYRLDSPSVVDMTSSSVELLDNSGFNNTTGSFEGWKLWCTSVCSNPSQGAAAVAISGCRVGSVGNCASLSCQNGGGNFFILGQYFPSVVGHVYNISFWFCNPAGGGGGNHLLVDVY